MSPEWSGRSGKKYCSPWGREPAWPRVYRWTFVTFTSAAKTRLLSCLQPLPRKSLLSQRFWGSAGPLTRGPRPALGFVTAKRWLWGLLARHGDLAAWGSARVLWREAIRQGERDPSAALTLKMHFLHMSLGPSDAWHNDHFSLENHVFLAFISIKWFLPLSICPATHGSFYLGSCPTLTSVDAKPQHTHVTDNLTLYSPLWQSPTCFTPLRPCFSYLTLESLAHPLCLCFSPVLTDSSSLPQLWCLSSACLTQMLAVLPPGTQLGRTAATHLIWGLQLNTNGISLRLL